MANIVPGVRWQPINYAGRPRRRKGRGAVGHVAVSRSKNLVPGPSADWHLYLPKHEPPIQYIDLDFVCYATLNGNPSLAAWESEGGMGTAAEVDAEPWTDNQLHWAAVILRHLHDTEGVPLEVMPDSRPASRGFGTHRLGIDPWRVTGGELWSSARGKLCPGDAKHAQRFEIVNRARYGAVAPAIEEDPLPYSLEQIADAILGRPIPTKLPQDEGRKIPLWEVLSDIQLYARMSADKEALVSSVTKAVNDSVGDGIDVDEAVVRDAISEALSGLSINVAGTISPAQPA